MFIIIVIRYGSKLVTKKKEKYMEVNQCIYGVQSKSNKMNMEKLISEKYKVIVEENILKICLIPILYLYFFQWIKEDISFLYFHLD